MELENVSKIIVSEMRRNSDGLIPSRPFAAAGNPGAVWCYGLTKFGTGRKLQISPCFSPDWKPAEMRSALRAIYPNATIVFYPRFEIIETAA